MNGPLKEIKSLVKKTILYPGITFIRCWLNRRKASRKLEIGPGDQRTPGFETLNIEGGKHVDYVWDCSKKLPFLEGAFELIYASHVLEHLPWYQSGQVLGEWRRVLKKGGRLEVWVPDALKICSVFVEAESGGENKTYLDGWYKFNPERDPCLWASGRIYTYGDGKGDFAHPNWHRALFTERYLKALFEKAGFVEIRTLSRDEVRGKDHGWINLGVGGSKGELP